MKFEVDGKIFDSEEEAVQFCAENEIPTASIVVFEDGEEESAIEENPEETPSKTECITEEELVQKANAKTLLENIDEITEEDKMKVIQKTLNLTQENREGEPNIKYFEEKETTENYIKSRYQKLIDKLSDVEYQVCPLCGREWSELEKDTEDLEQYKELETEFPIMRIAHIRKGHKAIWNLLKDLFEIKESKREYDDEEAYDQTSHLSETEELSKEELAEEIIKSPELRKELFRKWLEQKKEDRD